MPQAGASDPKHDVHWAIKIDEPNYAVVSITGKPSDLGTSEFVQMAQPNSKSDRKPKLHKN